MYPLPSHFQDKTPSPLSSLKGTNVLSEPIYTQQQQHVCDVALNGFHSHFQATDASIDADAWCNNTGQNPYIGFGSDLAAASQTLDVNGPLARELRKAWELNYTVSCVLFWLQYKCPAKTMMRDVNVFLVWWKNHCWMVEGSLTALTEGTEKKLKINISVLKMKFSHDQQKESRDCC